MDYKFQTGDRVECIKNGAAINQDLVAGMLGTVCHLWEGGGQPIGVRWDQPLKRSHNCSGTCEINHGWYVFPDDIRLVEQEDSVITPATDKEIQAMFGF